MKQRLTGILLLAAMLSTGCRTADDGNDGKTPLALTPEQTAALPILRKAIGSVTKKYPTNRIEECVILRRDVPNLDEVDKAIASVKAQPLADAFIFRPQIPSVQFFAYVGGSSEAILLSETNDEKGIFRRPDGEIGNPSLELLMTIFEQKCGPNAVKP